MIYLCQRTIVPSFGRWWGCTGPHTTCVHKQPESCDITPCRAEKPPILTPPLHILYIFLYGLTSAQYKNFTSVPYSMQYSQCRSIWVEGIIYLQLQDPAILGFFGRTVPARVLHHRKFPNNRLAVVQDWKERSNTGRAFRGRIVCD